jgi:hypothetical protein
VGVYVAYRGQFPEEATVDLVKELKKNNIEYCQLVEWPMENCSMGYSSTQERNSA